MKNIAAELSRSLTLKQKNQIGFLIQECVEQGATFASLQPLMEILCPASVYSADLSFAKSIVNKYLDGRLTNV